MNEQTIFLSIMDHTGDRKLKLNWNPEDKDSTSHIEEMFKDLQKKGYRFFSCKKVLGVFTKKGPEVKRYDPELGELIYEVPAKREENKSSLKIHEVEKEQKSKYEEPSKYNPSTDSLDTDRDYVATGEMRAG